MSESCYSSLCECWWGGCTVNKDVLCSWCDTDCTHIYLSFPALCLFAFVESPIQSLSHRHSGVIPCNPYWMWFSFPQNNPKQLQGDSAQSTDNERKVESSEGTKSSPFRPYSIRYRITVITFWAPCIWHISLNITLHSTTPPCGCSQWCFDSHITDCYVVAVRTWLHVFKGK